MATCDLCNGSAGTNSTTYTSTQMKQAVKAGLRPRGEMDAMAAAFGLSMDDAHAGWVQQVMSDSTSWVLCSACAARANSHL